MKRAWLLLILAIPFSPATGQDCTGCKPKLIRFEADGDALKQMLNANSGIQDLTTQGLTSLLESKEFKSKVVGNYPVKPIGFPFNKELCLDEVKRGMQFRDINCENEHLCSDPAVDEMIKKRLCFDLPCAMLLGSANMGQCPPRAGARPTHVNFQEPVALKDIAISPKQITFEKESLKACFTVNALEASLGVELEFQQIPGVTYNNLGVSKLNLKLDAKREVCMTAKLNIGSIPPLTEVKIESDGNFVSNEMINEAARGSELYGASYTKPTLEVLKRTVLPAIGRSFRSAIEDALKKALASSFETEVSKFLAGTSGDAYPTQIDAPSGVISEMGMANLAVKKFVELLDCSILKKEKKTIPPDHGCLTNVYPGKEDPYKVKDIPTPDKVAKVLNEQMRRYDQVTSQWAHDQIVAFEPRMNAIGYSQAYQNNVKPFAQVILNNQANASMLDSVELLSWLGNEQGTAGVEIGLVNPCNTELGSSSACCRKIENCPIQTYLDLDQLNRLVESMYKTGRFCHKGKGDFKPETGISGRPVRNNDGSPRGTGCLLIMEDDEDGMRCYLNGPPKLQYDSRTGGYKLDLKTKECFRGGYAFGLGKIAGDINFDISFTPTICGKGDFCLENGDADWKVVPGTARYALSSGSWLNGIVRKQIDKKLNQVLAQAIRIPLTSDQGILSTFPIRANGKIDKGPGYFGACFEPKN